MAITKEDLKKALGELGAKDLDGPWRDKWLDECLAKLESKKAFSVGVGGEKLGRCYHRSVDVTIGGDEEDVKQTIPKGNCSNYRVLEKGTHPLLGAWVRTSCEIDSSD